MRWWRYRGSRRLTIVGVAAIAILLAGCGANKQQAGVTITPSTATILISGSQLFSATVTGSSVSTVIWAVSSGTTTADVTPIVGGNATLGTITTAGLYSAPAKVPNPNVISVWATSTADATHFGTATVTIDSGIRVTVIPATETCTNAPPVTISLEVNNPYQFNACVTGTTNPAVTWAVNKIAGGNSSIGTITGSGLYTAPALSVSGVTISATSVVDANQSGSITLNVGSAADPTLTAINPSTVPQGAYQEDIYLTGTNFFSTSSVLLNGSDQNVTSTFISPTLIRARINAAGLAAGGTFPITVSQLQGVNSVSSPVNLTIQPFRPAVVSVSPNTFPQNSLSPSVTVTGGFFTLQTQATFDGQAELVAPQTNEPRKLNITLSSSGASSPFATPGLYPLTVQNPGVPSVSPFSATQAPGIAATNIAVSSLAADIATAPTTVGVGASPSSVAVNEATDMAVVTNAAAGTVSIVNLNTQAVTALPVGTNPTGVAVDDILNEALVVNNGSDSVSVVNLANQTVASPAISLANFTPPLSAPLAIGINPLTHRALVVNQSTNTATVIDLVTPNPTIGCTTAPCVVGTVGGTTNPISTGVAPEITVDPELNWAIVTPGGAGAISIVDLGQAPSAGNSGRLPNLNATFSLAATAQGVAVNSQTRQALLTDPEGTTTTLFSFLNQSTAPLSVNPVLTTLPKDEVAAAVNPLTNIGVTVNTLGGVAHVWDLNTLQLLTTVTVGANPVSVAIDPASNTAVVANQGGNSISLISLGPINPLQVIEASPNIAFASSLPLTLTITGNGFTTASTVRLDQGQGQIPVTSITTAVVPSSCVPNPPVPASICRQLAASIPANTLSFAHRFVVDVQNGAGGPVTNVAELAVIQPISVGSTPQAVAIDPTRELAIVTNQGDCTTFGSASVVNLTNGTAGAPITVGTCPFGAVTDPQSGHAIVTNQGDNTVSVIDMVNNTGISTGSSCSTCLQPEGIALDSDTEEAVIANFGSNNVSTLPPATPSGTVSATVDQGPVAVAVDPILDYAAVATASQTSTVDLLNLSTSTMIGRISNFQLPTGAVFDPIENQFLVADSESNTVSIIDPLTLNVTNFRAGINPTSLDYNFQTSTMVTANSTSNTLSVIDFLGQQVVDVLGIGTSPQFGVAIDPSTNVAVVVDQANNRVLLVPLPQ